MGVREGEAQQVAHPKLNGLGFIPRRGAAALAQKQEAKKESQVGMQGTRASFLSLVPLFLAGCLSFLLSYLISI